MAAMLTHTSGDVFKTVLGSSMATPTMLPLVVFLLALPIPMATISHNCVLISALKALTETIQLVYVWRSVQLDSMVTVIFDYVWLSAIIRSLSLLILRLIDVWLSVLRSRVYTGNSRMLVIIRLSVLVSALLLVISLSTQHVCAFKPVQNPTLLTQSQRIAPSIAK